MSRPAPALLPAAPAVLPAAPAHPARSSAGLPLTTGRRPELHLCVPEPRGRSTGAPGRPARRAPATSVEGRAHVPPAEIPQPREAPSPEPDYHDVVRSLARRRSRGAMEDGGAPVPADPQPPAGDNAPDPRGTAGTAPLRAADAATGGRAQVPAPTAATRTASDQQGERDDDALDGWARRFATAVLEAIDGRRPTTHLVRWTDEASYAAVRAAANRHRERNAASRDDGGRVARTSPPASSRLRLGGVGVCPIGAVAAEVSAVVLGPTRAHAMAFRLERRHDRWMASGLVLVR